MDTAQVPFASALSPATHAHNVMDEMGALALALIITTDHPTTAYVLWAG